MSKQKILIVDDEEDILKLLDYNLGREGYEVFQAATGEEALIAAKSHLPDLIILDLVLPGIDGLSVCRRLQSQSATSHIPIIMLTAKGEEADVVAGLELGAEDYVTKPFSPRILLARVSRLLRRKEAGLVEEQEMLSFETITIDPQKHIVTVNGMPVDLTITEFRILHALTHKPGWVFTRYQLVELSRGEDSEVTDRSVDVHIVSLRRKLGEAGHLVETVRGVGYRLTGADNA